jgi:hypothetical protein
MQCAALTRTSQKHQQHGEAARHGGERAARLAPCARKPRALQQRGAAHASERSGR